MTSRVLERSLGLKKTLRRFAASTATVAVLAVGMASAAQAACPFPKTDVRALTALSVRMLQNDMMVAALACNWKPRYNSFAMTYSESLIKNGKALKQEFERVHGSGSRKELNRFITALANTASMRFATQGSSFCDAAGAVYDQLIAVQSGKSFERFAISYAATQPSGPAVACGMQGLEVAETAPASGKAAPDAQTKTAEATSSE